MVRAGIAAGSVEGAGLWRSREKDGCEGEDVVSGIEELLRCT